MGGGDTQQLSLGGAITRVATDTQSVDFDYDFSADQAGINSLVCFDAAGFGTEHARWATKDRLQAANYRAQNCLGMPDRHY